MNFCYRKIVKRLLDLIVSGVSLVILSPLFVTIAVIIKYKIGSPVVFKQERPGLNEKVFTMYKFRTMTDKRGSDFELLPDSLRITRFGLFLRTTSLDELPGLINVLKGDMSMIGPRPLLVRYLPFYTETERARHKVRPGLSGLAQVSGRNNIEWEERLNLDVIYVNEMSFLTDAKIFFKTLFKAFVRADVSVVDQSDIKDLDAERSINNDT
ncbi:UDP-galactose phosphate transferase [Pontibacillus halophilus JSM 076056 = DSM 19796]|uniref:UDP-galactose phosphate transferase n=1 Tax=Pontibacillus halophilus JSM 076056 = DSM 19796 TaxID=1385510 RepID=A0A0A5I288_9BACI|nr:sugar transferase [Pontibacillus halophilus]KGX89957.1 UDP-galactose phosphate transferase [Pontibacillus halophilus JSM 076056 = DSM 19796]